MKPVLESWLCVILSSYPKDPIVKQVQLQDFSEPNMAIYRVNPNKNGQLLRSGDIYTIPKDTFSCATALC